MEMDSNKISLREHKQAHVEKRYAYVHLPFHCHFSDLHSVSHIESIHVGDQSNDFSA